MPARTWYVSCSPRRPEKIAPEIELLQAFEGVNWNERDENGLKIHQIAFAEALKSCESFEGKVSEKNPDFSARDRIAPMKTYGFAYQDSEGHLRITEAGRQLIRGERIQELFLKQMLKWQYPSYQHGGNKRTRHLYLPADVMCIFPFVATLRLAKELDGLTKPEIAIFVLTVFDAAKISDIMEEIQKFRDAFENISGRVPRKRFIREFHQNRFREIYSEEISSGKITTRESRQPSSIERFINTKVRNSVDIADAAIRYFRVTGLFTFGTKAFRLVVSPLKSQEVYQILNEMSLEPVLFYDDVDKFYEYLGNPDIPSLPWQTTNVMLLNLRKLQNAISIRQISESEFIQLTQNEQKEIILKLEETHKRQLLTEYEHDLQRIEMAKEIEAMFWAITQKEVIDPPLYFEWNMWRAIVCLNDCKCHPNFSLGDDFLPLSFAPGNKSDIEVEYNNDFVVLVEVTLSSGARQYDTEGEPVTRHIGKYQKAENDRENPRTVYGLFVAPSINPNTANYFFVHLKHLPNPDFGGFLSIIPLSIQQFLNIFTFCKIEHTFNRHKFRELLDSLVALGKNSNDSNGQTHLMK